ncbi:sperm-associated antigen 7-like protein [Plakobranchus ocellatus]|uniref:Sperm-associated antigen 7-like protein n=1 Tax=Plakobranchus ocellatus TaxID=259542 RepID=A0AAV4A028_9GAST|nr:sperm-associated antigen 7-like protein [Plakobranchus ocellatus]
MKKSTNVEAYRKTYEGGMVPLKRRTACPKRQHLGMEEEEAVKEAQERLGKDVKQASVTPSFNYRERYKHLIGDEAVKAAAKEMQSNTSYGFGIQGNENVDKLAKAALNTALYSGKLICWSDLKPKVNAYIHTVWQENWDTEGANNLHEVLLNLGEDLHRRGEGAGRKRETAMCRLWVGHTWL